MGTLVLLIGIPVLLVFNAALGKKIRESHDYRESTKQKIITWIGRVGLVLLIGWIILGITAFVKNCVPERPEPIESGYSSYAVDTAKERVKAWKSEGLLKLNFDNYEALVSLSFWNKMDLKAKEEFFSTILIYAETETGKKISIFEIKSNVDGSVLASYSSISGFDFIPEK